jgi:hypothetical protein
MAFGKNLSGTVFWATFYEDDLIRTISIEFKILFAYYKLKGTIR